MNPRPSRAMLVTVRLSPSSSVSDVPIAISRPGRLRTRKPGIPDNVRPASANRQLFAPEEISSRRPYPAEGLAFNVISHLEG